MHPYSTIPSGVAAAIRFTEHFVCTPPPGETLSGWDTLLEGMWHTPETMLVEIQKTLTAAMGMNYAGTADAGSDRQTGQFLKALRAVLALTDHPDYLKYVAAKLGAKNG